MGCITLPFKLLFILLLVVVLAAGWLYRDRVAGEAKALVAFRAAPAAAAVGRAAPAALRSARSKVDSLNGWGADSVVLTANEAASLIGDAIEPRVRRQLDSLDVSLLDGEIEVRALVATARLPKELVGPLAIALRRRERIAAAGPLRVTGSRRAEWDVRRLSLRGFPLPKDLVPTVMAKALGERDRHDLALRIPKGVREIRVAPTGLTLLGASRP